MRRQRILAACVAAGLSVLASGRVAGQGTFYATSSHDNVRLLTLDPDTGQVLRSVEVTNEEALFGGLTADGDVLYSIDGYNDGQSDRTFRIDAETGQGTVVGNTGQNWNFRCVDVHPITGVLYATRDNALYTLSKETGAASQIANIVGSTLDQATAFAINSEGEAYMTDIGDTGLFKLDLQTGAATHLGNLIFGQRRWIQDLAFDGGDILWAVFDGGGVYTIDLDNIELTLEFNSPFYRGLAFVGGDTECRYTITKVKATRCDLCPRRGEEYRTEQSCESPQDCRKKVKTTVACPEGDGRCKLKAKNRRCA